MRSPCRRLLGSVLVSALLLTGCASTHIVNQWSNPEYPSARFAKIMIVGVTQQSSIRRSFEDEFVTRLKSAGVAAVTSYRYIGEDGPVEEARLAEAVKEAGADATITTRLVERKARVNTSVYGVYQPIPTPYGYFRGGGAWFGYYEPATSYQYDVYVSETSLRDVKTNQIVWSGAFETEDSRDIKREIVRYVQMVIDALKTRNLLAAR